MRRAAAILLLVFAGCGPARDEGASTFGAAGKCACGGAKCGCVKPLCGGTRACGCGGTGRDCQCPAKLCKSAGVTACCNGTHADGGNKQRCDSHCACTNVKGACACSVSCACAWKNR